jgi:uncharacterized protein (TIRG00374 family)
MSLFAISNRSKYLLKLAASIALLALLLHMVDVQRLLDTLRGIQASWLGTAFALLLAELTLKTWKWLRLVRVHEPSAKWFDSFRSLCIGVALATLTPSSVGEVARGGFLPFPVKEALVGKSLLDKCIELYCVCSLAVAGLCLHFDQRALMVAALLASPVGIWMLPGILRWCENRKLLQFERFALLRRVLSGFTQASRGIVVSTYLLSLCFYLLYYIQVYVMFRAFGVAPHASVILFFPLITLSTIIPLTIGGVGIREGVAMLLLQQYGIAGATIFNAYFLLFVIDNVLTGLCGLALLPTLGKRT